MFETDPSIGLSAQSWRNKMQSDANARTANNYLAAYEEWKAHAQGLERRLADAEARIAELELKLAIERAHAGGMEAYDDEFRKAHPNSPVLIDSGKRYKKTGNIKTKGRISYEQAFDRIFGEARIPGTKAVDYRAD